MIWAIAACAESGPGASTVEVTDSAGVELVRNLNAGFDTMAVSLVEELRFGTADGEDEYQFFRIAGIEVDALGRILVANSGNASLRMYDANGRWVRDIGARGSGPGEFASVSTPVLRHDTIGVSDQQAMRFTLFDTAGALLASWSMVMPDNRALYPVGAGETGWAVWVVRFGFGASAPVRRPGDVTRDTTRVGRMGASELAVAVQKGTAFVDSALHSFLLWENTPLTWVQGSEGTGGFPPLFSNNVWWAVDGTGRFYLSTGPGYEIDVFGPDGRLRRRISRAFARTLVTDALVNEYLTRYEEAVRQLPTVPFDRMGNVRRHAEASRAAFLPPTGRIFVSDDGALWVERSDVHIAQAIYGWIPGATPTQYYYDVFDANGRYEFTVKPPDRFVPRWIGDGVVLGILRDENDVEYVARYRLVR
jgi:hypothetical protein